MSSLSRHTRVLDQGRIDVQFHVQHVGSIQYTIVENVRFSLLTVQTFPRGEKHTPPQRQTPFSRPSSIRNRPRRSPTPVEASGLKILLRAVRLTVGRPYRSHST
jgi:hypothetical protein